MKEEITKEIVEHSTKNLEERLKKEIKKMDEKEAE